MRAVFLVITLTVSAASAQDCRKACYPDEVRDASGCCVKQKSGATRPGDTSAVGCPYGQETSNDTAGHCCWPGQAWNGAACVGMPTRCPADYVVPAGEARCAPPTCTDGRERASDEVHCCWPSQAWSSAQRRCIGAPQCPETHAVSGEDCTDLRPMRRQQEETRRQAEAKRLADQRAADLAAAEAAEAAQRAAEAAKRSAYEAFRSDATGRRTAGVVLWVGGAVGFGLSALFAGLGAASNERILAGGLATPDDILRAERDGLTKNFGAYGALAGGGVCALIGTLLFLLSPDPGPYPAP